MVLMLDTHTLITTYGTLGIVLAMTLQTSIIPIPWELVIFTAIALKIPLPIVIASSCIGALLGGCACYALGKLAGLTVTLRLGKYIGINHKQIIAMEKFSEKYGGFSVFLGRALPFIPYKIFSITAGLIEIPFGQFVVFTILGLLPRLYLIAITAKTVQGLTPALFL